MVSTFAPWGEENEYLVGVAGCVLVLKCAPSVFAAAGPSCSQHKADGVPGTLWGCPAPFKGIFLVCQAYLGPTHLRLHGYVVWRQRARMRTTQQGP